jgi:hypothetical protein
MTEGIRELRRAAMGEPGNDELWGDLGDALRGNGDDLAATQAFLRAWHIDPVDGEWQRNLVELGAAAVLVNTMRAGLNESDDESLGDLADVLLQTGAREEACDLYRRAAELDPSDTEWLNHAVECGFPVPEGWSVEGAYVEEYGGYGLPEATDVADLTAQLGSNAGLLVRLGQAQIRAGDKPAATTSLWNALLVEHTNEEALQTWMVAASKTRREGLEKLRDTFPEDDELVGLLGDHYLDLGLRDRARDLYELAHRLDEDDPEWDAKRILLGATP